MSETELPTGNPFFEAPEAAAPEAPAEGEKPGFFTEEAPEIEADEKPAADPKKLDPKSVSGRIRHYKVQRDTARAEIETWKAKATAAEKAQEVFSKFYGRFKDPAGAVAQDASWMEALEAEKDHPAVKAALPILKQRVEQLTGTTRSPKETTMAENDPVAKLITSHAKTLIESTLSAGQIKPFVRKAVAQHILAAGVDLAELSQDQIVEMTRDYFVENEITEADAVDAPRRAASAPSGRAARATASSPRRSNGASETPEAPKDRDEWKRSHDERLRSFLTS